MGYNSNLSEKQNKAFNVNGGKRHKLYITGVVLRAIGLVIVVPFAIMLIGAGGWGIFLFLTPIPWVGILLIAFGQYFASNWKNK